MGASTAAKDRGGSSDPDAGKKIAKKVKERLGLTTVPNTPPPGTKWGKYASPTSTVAMNLKGKDMFMYGEEASKFTDDELIKRGLAKEGNYFKQVGGNFVRISKEEGRKLYDSGDPSVHRSVLGRKTAQQIKYGQSGGAMGSGDPTGIISSVPISSKMLESQNKMKTIIQGAIGLITPAPVSTIAKLGMAKSSADLLQPGAAYEDYTKKFQAKQAGKKFTSTRNVMGLLGLTGHKKKTLGE